VNLTPNSFGTSLSEKLGDGTASAKLKAKGLSGALIGSIGRKKYGSKRMAKWSAKSRSKK
jgi:hypothetical protein